MLCAGGCSIERFVESNGVSGFLINGVFSFLETPGVPVTRVHLAGRGNGVVSISSICPSPPYTVLVVGVWVGFFDLVVNM